MPDDRAINKVVVGTDVLMDLTNDTLTSAAQLPNGVTAHGADGNVLTGTAQIIPSRTVTITDKNQTIYIGGGTYSEPTDAYIPSGNGNIVQIDEEEQSKIISDNIPYGTSILGVDGNVYERAVGGALSDGTVQYYYLKPGTTRLQPSMFATCSSLKQVYNTESIREVYRDCFYTTPNLDSLSLPNLMQIGNQSYGWVGESAFCGCGSALLKEISLPSLTSIYGLNVFGGCSNLQTLRLPNLNITSKNSVYGGYLCESDVALQTVDISNSSVIPSGAFYGCSALTNIQVKNGAYCCPSSNRNKVATIDGITYMIQKSGSSYNIYRASDPTTVVATVTSSSTTATVDNVTFEYVTSGTYNSCIKITW